MEENAPAGRPAGNPSPFTLIRPLCRLAGRSGLPQLTFLNVRPGPAGGRFWPADRGLTAVAHLDESRRARKLMILGAPRAADGDRRAGPGPVLVHSGETRTHARFTFLNVRRRKEDTFAARQIGRFKVRESHPRRVPPRLFYGGTKPRGAARAADRDRKAGQVPLHQSKLVTPRRDQLSGRYYQGIGIIRPDIRLKTAVCGWDCRIWMLSCTFGLRSSLCCAL